jgi:hypothetical protein
MRFLLLLMTCLIFDNTSANNPTIEEVRNLYQKAAKDEVLCKKLIVNLQANNENNNLTLAAYKACSIMIMAKFVTNPIYKFSKFNDGKNLLEKCIRKDNRNVETRFLRFTVQCNAPKFLGYNSSMLLDKNFLLNAFSTINDKQLKNIVIAFLKTSSYLTIAEKQKLISQK